MAAIVILPCVAGAAVTANLFAFGMQKMLSSYLWKYAERGDAGKIARLLCAGLWLERKTKNVRTHLGHARAARHCSSTPLTPCAPGPQGRATALALAARGGHVAVLRLLLERGANVMTRDAVRRLGTLLCV